jgi:hypothetical protein
MAVSKSLRNQSLNSLSPAASGDGNFIRHRRTFWFINYRLWWPR